VRLKTREPVEGSRYLEGRLQSFQDGKITLTIEPKRTPGKQPKKKQQQVEQEPPQLQIELANVEQANLVPEI